MITTAALLCSLLNSNLAMLVHGKGHNFDSKHMACCWPDNPAVQSYAKVKRTSSSQLARDEAKLLLSNATSSWWANLFWDKETHRNLLFGNAPFIFVLFWLPSYEKLIKNLIYPPGVGSTNRTNTISVSGSITCGSITARRLNSLAKRTQCEFHMSTGSTNRAGRWQKTAETNHLFHHKNASRYESLRPAAHMLLSQTSVTGT